MKLDHIVISLLAALALTSCNLKSLSANKPQEPAKDRGQKGEAYESFAGASLCGSHLAFVGFAAGEVATELGKPIVVNLDVAVCGGPAGDQPESWKAIAVSSSTSEASVDGAAAKLFLSDAGDVALSLAGESKIIGKLASAEEAYPIELALGVVAEMLVEGAAFELGRHAKDEGGKSVALRLP